MLNPSPRAAMFALAIAALGGLVEIIPWRSSVPSQAAQIDALGWPPSIDQAKVYIERSPDKLEPCPKVGRAKHQCDEAGWAYVGEKADMQILNKRISCIWAHPIKDATTHIRYPKLEAATGDAPRKLRLAIDDRAITRDGGPVKITWRLGQEEGTHSHPNTPGWSEVTLPQGAGALQLSISADDVGRRHLCFELR